MDLQVAVLCVECEWIFDHASHCPRCGCQVIFPIARAMDRRLAAVGRISQPAPPPPRLVAGAAARVASPPEPSLPRPVAARPAILRARTA
jgi:hypothetical protein